MTVNRISPCTGQGDAATSTQSDRARLVLGPIPQVPRLAVLAHAASVLVSGIILLYISAQGWFFYDEWDFLANRRLQLGGPNGVLYPHNGVHWSTLPIIVWRALFAVVGVRDYWLYALPMIALHLLAATLLWRIMLRHDVNPWIATLLAATFLVLGEGWQNLVWAFQIGFVGSFAFGLLAVENVENGNWWLPAVWATLSLMCSGIGVPMVVTVVLVAASQRRWRCAIFTTVVPGAIFAIWWTRYSQPAGGLVTSLHELASFAWTGLTAAFAGYFHLPRPVGVVVLLVLLLAGLWLRSVPAVLAAGALPLMALIASGRIIEGNAFAASPRYTYLVIGLALPLMGQLLTLTLRSALAMPVVVTILAIVGFANLYVLTVQANKWDDSTRQVHRFVNAAAFLVDQRNKPPAAAVVYDGFGLQDRLTVHELTQMVADGHYPVPSSPPSETGVEEASLSVFGSRHRAYPRQIGFTGEKSGAPRCVTLVPPGLHALYGASLANPRYATSVSVDPQMPGSLLLEAPPGSSTSSSNPPSVTVTFAPVGFGAFAKGWSFVQSGDSWLNFAGVRGYTTATIRPVDASLIACQPRTAAG